jgi:Cas6b C-terminal domain
MYQCIINAIKQQQMTGMEQMVETTITAAPATGVSLGHITFPFSILPNELPAFRGAIIHAVRQQQDLFRNAGIATDLFHNHEEGEEQRQHLRQPVIVYQLVRHSGDGEIQREDYFPSIAAFGEGVPALALLAANMPSTLGIYRRRFSTHGFNWQQTQQPAAIQSQLSEYALYKWLALNPDNYTRYKANLRFSKRVALLETILRKNILGWYQAAGQPLNEKDLQVFLTEITAITHDGAELNGRRMFVFDGCFAVNLLLPVQMAIGNGTAWGYGKIRPLQSSPAHLAALQQSGNVL